MTAEKGRGEPMFTVVIPTRNRPELFQAALTSVLEQEGASLEVVAVNDGSEDAYRVAYAETERMAAGQPVTFMHLAQTATGHGVSYATNAGAARAAGRFLCFLDDDDRWIDTGYLARARTLVERASDAELLLFDQAAFRGSERVTQPIWLEDLGARLTAAGPGTVGPGYRVTVEELLTATGFCHLNTTIVQAELFRRIGGFDQKLGWEQDRDFFLRAIDVARAIVYCPKVVAAHNVPDAARMQNVTTRLSAVTRHLDQYALLHRAAATARHPAIRSYARRHRRYALQKAAASRRTWRDWLTIGASIARTHLRARS